MWIILTDREKSRSGMKELDFLFIYEHKVRELENLCLMKYELDRRGYQTEIIYINDAENAVSPVPLYHTRVLCMMACYNNKTLRWHVKDFVKFDKIIDLQWENIVYPKDESREGAYKNYYEVGKNVVHVSWGKQNVKRLLEVAHLDPEKVKLVGHVGMDFLREPLRNYYGSRKATLQKYGIAEDRKVILFASPYYGDQLSEEYIEDMCSRFGSDWRAYYEFMCESQRIVLDWFERICQEHPEVVIVFRPHPGHPSTVAERMAEQYDNFRIIAAESVKQWILVCDKVYTGNSSVIVEAFFARKDCQLLFPIPVTPGFELKMISESKHVCTYEEFRNTIWEEKPVFPTPQQSIEETYLVDWNQPSYMKFADMAEEVFREKSYLLTKKQLCNYKEYALGTRIIKKICAIRPLYRWYLKLLGNEKLQWKFLMNQRELRKVPYQLEERLKHERTSQEEMDSIIGKIQKALNP